MPADVLRLFVFARHAESAANAANMLNSNPSQPVALTARGRTQARALGAQLASLHVDLAVGTRLLRTRQTIDIALDGREVPTLIEPGFDEIRAGDLEGAPIEAYRFWQDQHTPGDRLPHGESIEEALRRYAGALRRLLDRTETVTLVVIHDLALRYIAAAAATGSLPSNGTAFPNAVPYLFDQPAARRAAASLAALTSSAHAPGPSRATGRDLRRPHRLASGAATMTVHVNWHEDVACRDADPDLFFPIGTTGAALRQMEKAKRICRDCPVRIQCLGWALENGAADGVWGGTTPEERRVIRSASRKMSEPETRRQTEDIRT